VIALQSCLRLLGVTSSGLSELLCYRILTRALLHRCDRPVGGNDLSKCLVLVGPSTATISYVNRIKVLELACRN
jgi:hypothetical protein